MMVQERDQAEPANNVFKHAFSLFDRKESGMINAFEISAMIGCLDSKHKDEVISVLESFQDANG